MFYMLCNYPETKVHTQSKATTLSPCFIALMYFVTKTWVKIWMVLKVIWGERAGVGEKKGLLPVCNLLTEVGLQTNLSVQLWQLDERGCVY